MGGTSFCIVGEQGAGKSTIADYMKKKFPGHERITSGQMWDRIVGRQLTHYERTVVQKEIVAERGEGYFVDFVMKWIKGVREKNPGRQFLVEGIRSREIFDALRKYFGRGMLFIGVTADEKVRSGRLSARDSAEEKTSEREKIDGAQFDLRSMVRDCDVVIANDFGDVESLYEKVESTLREIGEDAKVPGVQDIHF